MAEVSVVIPTYERPGFLRGAIETALGQTYEDLKVIVVDDGSAESYAEAICSDYHEVECFIHEENRGLSAARNTGIKASTGRFVAFLDDDDRWHREKIERQVNALEKANEAGIASCLVCAISPEGRVIRAERSKQSGAMFQDLLVSNVVGTPSRVLIRRECIETSGLFDENLRTKQDWDLYIRISMNWEVTVIDKHLCFRTIHESMSSSPESLERDRYAIIQKHRDTIEQHGKYPTTMANYHRELGNTYLLAQNAPTARSHYRKSLAYKSNPTTAFLLLFALLPATSIKYLIKIKRFAERTIWPPATSPDDITGGP